MITGVVKYLFSYLFWLCSSKSCFESSFDICQKTIVCFTNVYDNQGKLAVIISNRLYNGTVSVFGVLNDRFIQTSILFTLEIIAKSGFECSRPVAKFWSNFLQGKFQSRPGRALLRMTARVSHVWVCFCTWKTRKSFNYDEFDSLITNAINFALACSRC